VPLSSLLPERDDSVRAAVPPRDAVLVYVGAWMLGQMVASAVALSSGHASISTAGPGWLLAVAAVGWVPLLVAVWAVGRRHGTGSLAADFGLAFRPSDLWGVPIGVITQLVLLRLVYLPLRGIWPGTFSTDRLEQRARDLYDNASGGGVVLLVLAVVIGAPVVEELVYRGLLQGAATRGRRPWLGVVGVAAFFAAVHFQPVEIPGLFTIGLVLGACAWSTRRLGLGIVTHLAFNAAGLLLVARG
jgi:membrane protease YdiL (CAAX protease family)